MKLCSRCKVNERPPFGNGKRDQRYCRACRAAYMRETRPRHSELTDEARLKANARSYANTYQRRGKLVRQPCLCGDPNTEKHHVDYGQPLVVVWMCRACHLQTHQNDVALTTAVLSRATIE